MAMLALSLVIGYRPDDWTRFDHQAVYVDQTAGDGTLRIHTATNHRDTVALLGIQSADGAAPWLSAHVAGRQVILLLESPQTRDSAGRLRACAFLDNQNLSVELVKAGLARANRREKTQMDGLIRSAEADARKKKIGLWMDFASHEPTAHAASQSQK